MVIDPYSNVWIYLPVLFKIHAIRGIDQRLQYRLVSEPMKNLSNLELIGGLKFLFLESHVKVF